MSATPATPATHASQRATDPSSEPAEIVADHAVLRRLGHWTTAGSVKVRARRSTVLIDLRSPGLADDLDVFVQLDHATVTLLVRDHSAVDAHALTWSGRGRVHDEGGAGDDGRVRVSGHVHDGQIRVRRAGFAQVTAMLTREYLAELWSSRRTGRYPTIDDPRRPETTKERHP